MIKIAANLYPLYEAHKQAAWFDTLNREDYVLGELDKEHRDNVAGPVINKQLLTGALGGAALGGAMGLPFGGIGAVPGAAIGGLLGAASLPVVLGAYSKHVSPEGEALLKSPDLLDLRTRYARARVPRRLLNVLTGAAGGAAVGGLASIPAGGVAAGPGAVIGALYGSRYNHVTEPKGRSMKVLEEERSQQLIAALKAELAKKTKSDS